MSYRLPSRRYRGSCGDIMCPCATPGPVCDEWMGWKPEGYCPRCGWNYAAHAVETVRALVRVFRG